jgi:presequence protease
MGTLGLLCTNLSRGYLWDAVRVEGGAYGAFASASVTYPVFSCASYRDPNLVPTLERFAAGLKQAATALEQAAVDDSIVATIGQIDKPKAPHAKGFGETCALLLGRTREFRQTMRDAVLGATPASVMAKAAEILRARESAITVLGSADALDKAAVSGLKLIREKLTETGKGSAEGEEEVEE